MASSSLTPYKDNTNQVTFSLVSTSADKTAFKVSGRSIACPYTIELSRKLSTGKTNDHVQVRVAITERNTTTSVLATGQVLLDISIPKDQSIITNTVMTEVLGVLASLLDQATANNASSANRTALIEGRDL